MTPTPDTALAARLLPCPFCGEDLRQPRDGLNYRHPDNKCFIGRRVFTLSELEPWNTRSGQLVAMANQELAVAVALEAAAREADATADYIRGAYQIAESIRELITQPQHDAHNDAVQAAVANAVEASDKALRDALAYIDKGHHGMARNILAAAIRARKGDAL